MIIQTLLEVHGQLLYFPTHLCALVQLSTSMVGSHHREMNASYSPMSSERDKV
jgi:hypothetical protein